MEITLELGPAAEAKLLESAARHDREAIRRLLVDALDPAIEQLLQPVPPDLSDAEFERLADELAERFEKSGPPFVSPPDEAISREGIYGDHP